MSAPASVTPAHQQILTFQLDAQVFGVDILRVREIRGWSAVTAMPETPSYVLGVLNLRGAVVPVIDLSVRFGRASAPVTKRTCIVIIEVMVNDERQVIGIVVDATSAGRAIGPNHLDGHELEGKAVLIHTGWSRHFGTPAYGSGHSFVTEGAARRLVDGGAVLVGIDSLNIDDIATGARPVHTALLEAGVAIVEHLTGLDRLPAGGFRFFAAAPKFRGAGSFPVRAFALVE